MEITTCKKLLDDINSFAIFKPFKDLAQVWMIELLHDFYFIVDSFQMLLGAKTLREDFNASALLCFRIFALPDFTEVSETDHFSDVVHFSDGIFTLFYDVLLSFEHLLCVHEFTIGANE